MNLGLGSTLPLLETDSRAAQDALAKKLAAEETAKVKAKAKADKAAAAKLLTKEARAKAMEAAAAAAAAKPAASPAPTLEQTLEAYRAELEPTLVAIVSGAARRGDGSPIDTASLARAVVDRLAEVDILRPMLVATDNIVEELRRCAAVVDRAPTTPTALETFAAFIETTEKAAAVRINRIEDSLSKVASSNRAILDK